MADVKKHIEELARQAKINAKGQKMACGCSTCREATDEADKIMVRLTTEKCSTFALSVAILMYYRLSQLHQQVIGPFRLNDLEDDLLENCERLGLSPDALTDAINNAVRTRIQPKDGPV